MSGHSLTCIARQPSRWLCVVALFAAGTAPVQAQSSYPSRPIQLIVPYGAGGVADVSTRVVAEKLSTRLKQQFVIDNRPGAAGIVAAKNAAAAIPDGHTTLLAGNNNAISAALFKSLPYDILTDFASTSTTSFFDMLLVTRAGSPLKSVQDVIRTAKANPGKLNIGTVNPGSTQNLAAELFRNVTDIKVTIVLFRTSADLATALLRGDVDFAFEFFAATHGMVDDNKLAVLASTGPRRNTYLPDVPTVQEGGLKDFEVMSWAGISVPAATPKDVVAILTAAINEVVVLPDVLESGKRLGMEMRGSTPEEMTARMKADIAKWSAVIEQAAIPKRD
jgi:tripartite-type tricarboxylate transporter receptor subunit TctC